MKIERLYSIGIDPGERTGFCAYDRELKGIKELRTTNFLGAIHKLKTVYPPENVHKLIIEIPHNKDGSTNNHVWHDITASKAATVRLGINVGRVLREAELLIKMAEDMGYTVIKANPQGKVDKHYFRKVTGWTAVTNPHERDAGMLVFGV